MSFSSWTVTNTKAVGKTEGTLVTTGLDASTVRTGFAIPSSLSFGTTTLISPDSGSMLKEPASFPPRKEYWIIPCEAKDPVSESASVACTVVTKIPMAFSRICA